MIAVLVSSGCTTTKYYLSTTNETLKSSGTQSTSCLPDYNCDDEWSECIEPGLKLKFCTDENKCGNGYIVEGSAKNIIHELCDRFPSKEYCQKNIKIITETCNYEIPKEHGIGDTITKNGYSITLESVKPANYNLCEIFWKSNFLCTNENYELEKGGDCKEYNSLFSDATIGGDKEAERLLFEKYGQYAEKVETYFEVTCHAKKIGETSPILPADFGDCYGVPEGVVYDEKTKKSYHNKKPLSGCEHLTKE
jgi:hypothetical protein